MNDLRNELDRLAGPAHVPTHTEIEADLNRGRRALRRRRTVQAMAGSTFAAAALVAAVAVATSGTVTPAQNPPPAVIAAELVAYTGKQPNGFTIDKVPAGFYIQGDNDYTLVIAPENQEVPSDNPSLDVSSPDVFIGKIVVMLESADQSGPGADGDAESKPVQVGDRKGVLVTMPGDSASTLWVEQPNGVWLLLQFWEGLGLSETAMVEMGAGVHVHADAKQGRG